MDEVHWIRGLRPSMTIGGYHEGRYGRLGEDVPLGFGVESVGGWRQLFTGRMMVFPSCSPTSQDLEIFKGVLVRWPIGVRL